MVNEWAIAWTSLSVATNGLIENKPIVRGISGGFKERSLNAVMGPSGCGKTTLLKCFNNNSKYVLSLESKIFVKSSDNRLKPMKPMKRLNTIFVSQNQNQKLMFGLSVGQALSYASKVKNNCLDAKTHKDIVNRVMTELMITDIEDNRIEKCSGGQIKRICIGLELTSLNTPDILFIDEPTTGLDSSAAQQVSQLSEYSW